MGKNWFLIISFLLLSCVNQGGEEKDTLIPKESFKNILIDIEKDVKFSSSESKLINGENPDSLLLINVLKQHNYSYELYERTLRFYINKPQEMTGFLSEVKDSLGS